MQILRVFPHRTSVTPTDALAFVGDPPFWRPEADEVHVSVCFTWDIAEGRRLADAWGSYYPRVMLGGPALGTSPDGFVAGCYVKHGVTFTTRGCNNECPWCLVRGREGKLREIDDFEAGNIVQDNNLLQASRSHISRVISMLSEQPRAAQFKGGLESCLIDDDTAEALRGIRISEVWLAADCEAALKPLGRAVSKLAWLGLRSNRLRCYALIGFNGETIEQADVRLERVWEIGALPFAQLYQPDDHWIDWAPDWKRFARQWQRPAIIRARH